MKKSNLLQNQSARDQFSQDIVGKVFKILPIWEDCKTAKEGFDDFHSYLDKIITMLIGTGSLCGDQCYYEIAAILKGMQFRDDLTQKKVKSLVFHCIDLLDKKQKSEV